MLQKIVNYLKRMIPDMKGVDVFLNDSTANRIGPYAISATINDLEAIEKLLFSLYASPKVYASWMEPKGIYLPSDDTFINLILSQQDVIVLQDLITNEFGYCNDLMVAIHMILHELGHIVQLRDKNMKPLDWMIYHLQQKTEWMKRSEQYNTMERAIEYRKRPIEAFADRYALNQMKLIYGGR